MGNRLALSMFFFISLLLPACTSQEPEKPNDRVTLQLKWVHQAQFAGFYMAREKGYYADEG
jgi:NitT/TauT family transport system substrate-binding protein